MKPKRKVKNRWSPEVAYAIGLITTDGSLSADGRHIVFVSKDLQLLKTFKRILDLKNKIGSRKSTFTKRKDCHHVQFGDIVFYKWLLGIGLSPNKTKTIKKLKIPDKYFFDFLRGVFDGDGTCYGYWDRRWKSSFAFYICFYSASLSFIKWIRQNLKKILGTRGSVSFSTSEWRLKYAKKESGLIFPKMYYRENLPCLKRKYQKLDSFIEIDGRVLELVDSLD